MHKKRLLVTISYSFSIRYIYRTGLLKRLSEFCTPVVCLTWQQDDLIEELKNDGFEVHIAPLNTKDSQYANARHKIDIWFKYFRLKGTSKKIQARYLNSFTPFKKKFLHNSRELFNYLKFRVPGAISELLRTENELVHTHTNYTQLSAFVDSLNVEAVFTVTPFHRQEDVLLRACKDKGKLMLTSILSFDNITKRGWMPVEYDAYAVWNQYNKDELQRIYPQVTQEKIHIVGAPQFDFYFKNGYLLEEKDWREIVGLTNVDEGRKIILYAGGPRALFPHEPDYLKDIDDAINAGQIKGDPVVLFRCHPIDTVDRWKKHIGDSKNIVFDKSWTGEKNFGETNITVSDIKKLCSTLAYTDVHINLCSTMTVDGSAFNKPQIGPAYYKTDKRISQLLENMYWQEHFIPIMKTGKLLLARSKNNLIDCINKSLTTGNGEIDNSTILENVITYTDGESTERVLSVLQCMLTVAG